MQRMARLPNAWVLPFGAIILIAWMALALDSGTPWLQVACAAERWDTVPVSLQLALMLNSPDQLALGWALMVIAMMLPLALSPLRHVRVRSFARRRERSTLLFVVGFVAVWMAVGVILQTVALIARWATPGPLLCLVIAIVAALLWQVSPAKQWFLNRCHQRPALAAFGFAADLDAFGFGIKNGAGCAGACWALMLPMLLAGQGAFALMVAAGLFSFAESLETPAPLAWRWRGGAKALRILAAWWPKRNQPRIREVYP
jgi:predicted metal-binding membrane protein